MKNYNYVLNHSVKGSLTLTHSPINWNDKTFTFTRHDVYKSVLASFSLELGFPREGATYLKDAYETYGIDEVVTITITQLDKSDFGYDAYYTGIVDLSTYREEEDVVYCSVIQDDVLNSFLNRDEIDIDLNRTTSLNDDAITAIDLTNDMLIKRVNIYVAALYSLDSPFVEQISETYGTTTSWEKYFGFTDSGFEVNEIGTDATLPNLTESSTAKILYTNSGADTQKILHFYKTTLSGTITITGAGDWTVGVEIKSGSSTFYTFSDSGSGADTITISATDIDEYITRDIASSGTHSFYVKLSGTTNNAGVQSIDFVINNTDIDIQLYEYTFGRADENKEVIFPHEAATKIIQLTTADDTPLYSTILGRTDSEIQAYASDGDLSLIGISSGNMLRGYSLTTKGVNFSFRNLFKSLSAVSPIGLWYDNANKRFEIESIDKYYSTAEILDLGEVSELEISVDTKLFFNSILGGYSADYNYEDIGSAQNFNCKTEWTNAIKRVKDTLDISSPFRGDDYGIELARQKPYDEYYGEDMESDDDLFLIYGQRDGSDFESLQGFDDFDDIKNIYGFPSRLNLDITPARNLLRNKSLVAVGAYKNAGDVMFSSSKFRTNLGTQKSGEANMLYEKDNITATTLGEPLFYPEVYNFKKPVTAAIIQTMLSNPHGYVSFSFNGSDYKGYIQDVSTESFERNGNWTLIRVNPNRL